VGNIRILPTSLVNMIAAGEVIERPASVVKELLENAVDAGAEHIELYIEDGGKRLIRVVDDGCGMDREDLALALRPHATSKLQRDEELFEIATMGFRGEALASIASVARVRITSRPPEQPQGYEISAEAGKLQPLRPAASAAGTIVEVRDLFFNVPARAKFLRSRQTEFAHIVEHMQRVALAWPQIHLRLMHNGRLTHELPAGQQLRQRIGELFGPALAKELIEIHAERPPLKITALLGKPSTHKANTQFMYFFVNGRYVRDRFLRHAVQEAYRSMMPQGRYPVVFVYITLPPEKVDVNVHPTKIEVRWRDSQRVHAELLAVLREYFLRHDLTAELVSEAKATAAPATAAPATAASEHHDRIERAITDFLQRSGTARRPVPPPDVPQPAYSPPAPTTRPTGREPSIHLPPAMPTEQGSDPGKTPAALQVHNSYLIVEEPDAVVIIDQHALHERIIYEQLHARLAQGRLESQRLLIPETIELSATQLAALEKARPTLERLGFELESFGPRTVAVQAVPAVLPRARAAELIEQILDKLDSQLAGNDREAMLQELLQQLACRAAIKAGQALSPQEIAELLRLRQSIQRTSNCPHGRPVSLRMSLAELEKRFKRS